MKLALAVVLAAVLALLAVYFYGDSQSLVAYKIAALGFVAGYAASRITSLIKTLRFDGLLKDFHYAKMRHELRRSIKP